MSIPDLDLCFKDFMSVFIVGFMVFLLQVIQTLPWVHCGPTTSSYRPYPGFTVTIPLSPLAEVTSYVVINSTASYFLAGTFSRK